MQVFHSFEEAQDYTATVVALGTFDGVHLGHQMVMKTAIDTARRLQAKAVVVTFAAHPLSVLCPEKEPARLATVKQKERYIKELGLDGLVLLPMNRHLIDESPDEFCQQLLDYLHPKSVVVGANFTYGARAAGNTETLRDFMDGHGVPVQVLHLLERPGRRRPSAVRSSANWSCWVTWKRRPTCWADLLKSKGWSWKVTGGDGLSASRRPIWKYHPAWLCHRMACM